jgi:hypothetical protein
VAFGSWMDCREDAEPGNWHGGIFDAVILRLGVQPPKPLGNLAALRFGRHSLPYHPVA